MGTRSVMASGRTLTVSELGLIRYEQAKRDGTWPIEVRLLPQHNDTSNTVYTLHTPANTPVSFVRTRREELRAMLDVPPGALVYEVLRDGVLVSTGGLEVRPPQPMSPSVPHALRLSSRPPSGARQLAYDENDQNLREGEWLVQFVYEELPWTVRDVWVHDDRSGKLLTKLDRFGEGFSKTIGVSEGPLVYRFCVVAHDALQSQLAALTRLGWDDGAMVHASQLMTWPLTIHVEDLSVPGNQPSDGLVRVPEIGPMEKGTVSSSLTTGDDDEDDDDEDDFTVHPHSADDNASKKSSSKPQTNKVDMSEEWHPKLSYKSSPVPEDSTSQSYMNDHEEADTITDETENSRHRRNRRRPSDSNGSGGFLSVAMGAAMFVLGSTVTLVLGKRGFLGKAMANDSLSISDDASEQSIDSKRSYDRRKSTIASEQRNDSAEDGDTREMRSFFRPHFGNRS